MVCLTLCLWSCEYHAHTGHGLNYTPSREKRAILLGFEPAPTVLRDVNLISHLDQAEVLNSVRLLSFKSIKKKKIASGTRSILIYKVSTKNMHAVKI